MKTREEAVQDSLVLLKEKTPESKIEKALKKEGFKRQDVDDIIWDATKLYYAKSSKIRKNVWAGLTLVTFVLFFFLIPNSIYNISPMLLSFIGAALFTFFLIQSLADFRTWDEYNTDDAYRKDWRHELTPYMFIPGFVMIFIFVMHFNAKENSELKESGVKVTGVIRDGTSVKMRRGGTYSVTVEFKTKEGTSYIVEENVGENEFSHFHTGDEVELIYSIKDPTIIELFTTKETIRDYTGSEERDLTVNDLLQLLSVANTSETGASLNKINYGWAFDTTDSVWINKRTHTAIKLNAPYSLRCLSN